MSQRLLPGFRASVGATVGYLGLLVALPLAACVAKSMSLGPAEFLAAAWSPRARAAYALTFGAAFVAAAAVTALGGMVAWTLVRYRFPGRTVLDALVDLPLALPTAVAGLAYGSLYAANGWFGRALAPLGIVVAHTPAAIVLVLMFVGLPFAVRAVQPAVEELDGGLEEAAASLGASRWLTLRRVVFPELRPALAAAFTLAFARGVGEYGSVMFVSSNIPFRTEIAPALVVASLEAHELPEAAAIATVLLALSLAALTAAAWLQRRRPGDG